MCCSCLLLEAALAGCGSASSPPLTVSCNVHKLPGGLVRANVTLKNTSAATSNAYLYGAPLTHVTHIYPALAPGPVTVTVSGSSRSYVGFLVPHVRSGQSVHVLIRLAPPLHGKSLVASTHHVIKASNWSVLNNSDCVL